MICCVCITIVACPLLLICQKNMGILRHDERLRTLIILLHYTSVIRMKLQR